MKICTVCNQSKPLSDYGIDRRSLTRGGDGLNCKCKECVRITSKVTRDKDVNRRREIKQKYRHNNPEATNKSRRKQRAKNPEKYCLAARALYKKNPEKAIAIKHNRRTKIAGNGGVLSPERRQELFVLQRGRCAVCKKKIPKLEMDHYIPVKLGGSSDDINFQLLCKPCNCSKGAKHPIDFMQSKGFLL